MNEARNHWKVRGGDAIYDLRARADYVAVVERIVGLDDAVGRGKQTLPYLIETGRLPAEVAKIVV